MRGNVVDAAASGEGNAAVERRSARAEQCASLVFDSLADVRHKVALFQCRLDPLACDSVALGGPPRLFHEILEAHCALKGFLLQIRPSVSVLPIVPKHAR